MPECATVVWLAAIEEAHDSSFKIQSVQLFGGLKKRQKICLQQLPQCYCRINAAQMKDDGCLFTPGLHKSLRTHTCAGIHTHKRIHKCKNSDKHDTTEDNRFMFFLSNAKRQPKLETDGIIYNPENCPWPRLMMVNNPNECNTYVCDCHIAICIQVHVEC